MKPAILPAVLIFAVTACALLAVRERLGATQTARAETLRGPTELASEPAPLGGRTAQLRKEADGHFWATARVQGTPVRFLVDTGASVIALTPRDARRIGLDLDHLPRTAQVTTAAGKVSAAWTTLGLVSIGKVEAREVQAVIIDEGLEQSLLGMSFLNQMRGWNVTQDAIVVRQ